MCVDNVYSVFKNDSDFEHEGFDKITLIIVFPRRGKIFRPKADYFSWCRDDLIHFGCQKIPIVISLV